jgi:cysteine desulfurase/selenocysteine lyase
MPTEDDLRALPSFLVGASTVWPENPVPAGKPSALPYFVNPEKVDSKTAMPSLGDRWFELSPAMLPELGITAGLFVPRTIRQDFPILQERIHGRQLVWLDNGATTQKPNAVIDRISSFYRHENSNYNVAPARFEAGTGSIADAVGLGAALDYLSQVGIESVTRYEHELL